MNNKPKTKKQKQWMRQYMKYHPNSGQFRKGHKSSKKTLLKISESLTKAHKLFPNKWKRTKEERIRMSKTMENYHINHPELTKKCVKANKKRKYNKHAELQNNNHSIRMKNYFKTHSAWNKGLKTGLKPKTIFKKGKNHPGWNNGISLLPYPFIFKALRKEIRKRDNNTCQICGMKQKELKGFHKKLSVHHIDYNKQNCNKKNLISLCPYCHDKTNFNRDYWFAYFMYITGQEIN